MGFLDKVKGLFAGAREDERGIYVYACCAQCGEVLRGRIDLRHEMTPEYDDKGRTVGYFSRKVLIGSKSCFNQVEILSKFDKDKQMISQEVRGGELVDEATYAAYIAETAK